MTNDFINKKRDAYVKVEAAKLFDLIIQKIIAQKPATVHKFSVSWPHHEGDLDSMIFERVERTFEEISATINISRGSSVGAFVEGSVMVTGAPLREEYVKKLFWSRAPGKFVNKTTGQAFTFPNGLGPTFSGTVREWYETLVETLIDAGNHVEKVMLAQPDSVHVGPDVLTLLQCSVLFRPTFSVDDNDVQMYEGTLSNRFKVFKDSSLTNTCRLSGVANNVRFVAEVVILDMNII